MAFLAGVDEAGYGPPLGPLVVGHALFRVPDPEVRLGSVLRRAAAPGPRRSQRDRRLWLDDSKKVHQGPHGRRRMARTVAAFRRLMGAEDPALASWVAEPPCGDARLLHAAPWFLELDGPLCPEASPDRARLDAALLGRHLDRGGCGFAGFGARVVPAVEWNGLLDDHGNKGAAHAAVVFPILVHLVERVAGAPLRIEVDRLGGRIRYGALLRRHFPDARIEVHDEGPAASLYTLHLPERSPVQVRFSEGADGRHAQTALASLAAKQTRERLMDLFNDWFAAHDPALEPTRGYAQDANRWLADAAPLLERLALDRRLLVRER